jgi:hypothetical protein
MKFARNDLPYDCPVPGHNILMLTCPSQLRIYFRCLLGARLLARGHDSFAVAGNLGTPGFGKGAFCRMTIHPFHFSSGEGLVFATFNPAGGC